MKGLVIERSEEDGWRVMSLVGSVDASTFVDLEAALTQEVESGCCKLQLDCSNLSSINSTGLGLLLATHRQMRQQGGELAIHGMHPDIAGIFNLLGFSRLIQGEDEDEGMAGTAVC